MTNLDRWRRRLRRRSSWVLAGIAALVVTALVVVGLVVWLNAEEEPPRLPGAAGTLFSAQSWDGPVIDGIDAWRIEYDTERWDGRPASATGLVVAASDWDGPERPVLAWAHGAAGISEDCARSAQETPFDQQSGLLAAMIAQGWVVVASDYAGLGSPGPHAFLVGRAAAHDVLNAVRAAGAVSGLDLSPNTVVWGASQGGHAAIWTGIVADDYAPDIDLLGVAAVAPPTRLTDIPGLSLGDTTRRGLVAALLASWHRVYPESGFWEQIPDADKRAIEAATRSCTLRPTQRDRHLNSLDPEVVSDEVLAAGLADLLAQNAPTAPIPVPVFVAQGTADDIVTEESQSDWVDERCAAGQAIDYRTYDGLDHYSVLSGDTPVTEEIITWTVERLVGAEPTPTCN